MTSRPMRFVHKSVYAALIPSPKGSSYDQLAVAIRLFYEIYTELGRFLLKEGQGIELFVGGGHREFHNLRVCTSTIDMGSSSQSGVSFDIIT